MNWSKKMKRYKRKDYLIRVTWKQRQVSQMETTRTPRFIPLAQRNFYPSQRRHHHQGRWWWRRRRRTRTRMSLKSGRALTPRQGRKPCQADQGDKEDL